jgi:hypothetical protein
MKLGVVLGFVTVLALTATASAQIEPFSSGNVVKIGVLTDSRAFTPISAARDRSRRREWRSPISAAP